MNDLLIVQYAKWPELGKVKTRLAKSLGDQQALAIHMKLMSTVFANLRQAESGKFELWLNKQNFNSANFNDSPEQKMVLDFMTSLTKDSGVCFQTQQGVSLGDKMAHTFQAGLQRFQKVIIVGSDCPNVSKDVIQGASKALDGHDLVLGPAEDGGYVLIGARCFESAIFTNVEWGKGKVLETTLNNAKNLDYSVFTLAESWDVDELDDYNRWIKGA
mgnify:CR=1 FL=1